MPFFFGFWFSLGYRRVGAARPKPSAAFFGKNCCTKKTLYLGVHCMIAMLCPAKFDFRNFFKINIDKWLVK
jgi:hypothetical protein